MYFYPQLLLLLMGIALKVWPLHRFSMLQKANLLAKMSMSAVDCLKAIEQLGTLSLRPHILRNFLLQRILVLLLEIIFRRCSLGLCKPAQGLIRERVTHAGNNSFYR